VERADRLGRGGRVHKNQEQDAGVSPSSSSLLSLQVLEGVCEPQIRARLGTTALFCEVACADRLGRGGRVHPHQKQDAGPLECLLPEGASPTRRPRRVNRREACCLSLASRSLARSLLFLNSASHSFRDTEGARSAAPFLPRTTGLRGPRAPASRTRCRSNFAPHSFRDTEGPHQNQAYASLSLSRARRARNLLSPASLALSLSLRLTLCSRHVWCAPTVSRRPRAPASRTRCRCEVQGLVTCCLFLSSLSRLSRSLALSLSRSCS